MSDAIRAAMEQLTIATDMLKHAVENYTEDTDRKLDDMRSELTHLQNRVSKRETTMRKIAQAILEEQDGQ